MEQLARKGGVTKPILYRHFGDRDGLVDAIGERFAGRLITRLGATLDADDPQELLRRTIDGYLAFLEEDPELYSFLVRQAPASLNTDDGRAPGASSSLVDVISRQVAVVIGDRLRADRLDAGGAEPMAFGIVGMVHQAGDWWLRTRTMSRSALVDYLTELLWSGFSGLGPGPSPTSPDKTASYTET